MKPIAYRINDFAATMGISRTTIYGLIKAGKIKPIRLAGRTLIPAIEAERLVAEASE